MHDLRTLLAEHLATPFPTSVVKGVGYGAVDPVLIDADIYGWGSQATTGRLTPVDRERLQAARDDLAASLEFFPEDARPYYAKLIQVAEVALM